MSRNMPRVLVGLVAAAALAVAATGAAATERVVAIGGAVTEIVYALGAGDRLLAVDTTSLYPPAARALPNVGYMRQLAAEPIVGLAPTLVLAEADAGPLSVLEQIRAAGVAVTSIPDEPSPVGVIGKVRAVAGALALPEEGEALVARLERSFASLRSAIAATAEKPTVLFVLSVGTGATLVAGRETSADGIVTLAGARNAVTGFTGFKPLSGEAAIAAAPDVVLVTDRTLDLLGGREALFARPDLAATPAGRAGRLIVMDGLLLLGFGPRTPEAVRTLALALHPALDLPAE